MQLDPGSGGRDEQGGVQRVGVDGPILTEMKGCDELVGQARLTVPRAAPGQGLKAQASVALPARAIVHDLELRQGQRRDERAALSTGYAVAALGLHRRDPVEEQGAASEAQR